MDWSINEISQRVGTTSRTLRHYDAIGLLTPSRIGSNGYRYYDADALVRLQRILLLRELGVGLPTIADILAGEREHTDALRVHLEWLRREKGRLDRQIRAVEGTITTLMRGEDLMASEMFDGFDHTQYRQEVEERWGTRAYVESDAWWRAQSPAEQRSWQQRLEGLCTAWVEASQRGVDPAGAQAQVLAQQHFDWLREVPGTPGSGANGPTREYFVGLAQLYVTDDRFAANFGGPMGAAFVRAAMTAYAEANL